MGKSKAKKPKPQPSAKAPTRAKPERKPKPRQQQLPGVEDKQDAVLSGYAREYVEARDHRIEVQREELRARDKLRAAMEKRGLTVYHDKREELVVEIVPVDLKITVKEWDLEKGETRTHKTPKHEQEAQAANDAEDAGKAADGGVPEQNGSGATNGTGGDALHDPDGEPIEP